VKRPFSLCALLAFALPLLGAGMTPLHAATLFTPNFKMDVMPQCPEGTVGCDKVEYVGVDKTPACRSSSWAGS
jgi:hypothetical protein